MDNIFCIECGFELPSVAKFCKKCGVQIEASEFFPKKKIVQAEDVARHQYYGRESTVKPEIKEDKQPTTEVSKDVKGNKTRNAPLEDIYISTDTDLTESEFSAYMGDVECIMMSEFELGPGAFSLSDLPPFLREYKRPETDNDMKKDDKKI